MKNKIRKTVALLFVISVLFSSCRSNSQDSGNILNNEDARENGKASVIVSGNYVFAANYFLEPPANAAADCSEAMRSIIEDASVTGGTVYLKSGVYRFSSPIELPDNVSLRGDFASPDMKAAAEEQTTLVVSDTEANRNSPFITLGNNSSVSGIKIRYDVQSYAPAAEYPFAISVSGKTNITIENITVPNGYSGIDLNNSENAKLRNIYITAAAYGIKAEGNTGITSFYDVNVSPVYYLNDANFVAGKDFSVSSFKEGLTSGLTGIYIGDSETVSLYNCSVDSAKGGLRINIPVSSSGTVSAAGFSAVNCHTALFGESLGSNGAVFESSVFGATGFSGSESVYLSENYTTEAVFSNCRFTGFPDVAMKSEGTGLTSVSNCSFVGWHQRAFETSDKAMSVLFSYFGISKSLGILDNYSVGMFIDCEFQEETLIEGGNYIENDEKSEYSIPSPEISSLYFSGSKPPANSRYIKVSQSGIETLSEESASEDFGPVIQKAIDTAAENGAGIVFIEPGIYNVKTPIILKENINLVGSGNNLSGGLSVNIVYNIKDGGSLFTLANGSSVSDMVISDAVNFTSNSENTETVLSQSYAVTAENVSSVRISGITFENANNSVCLKNVSDSYITDLSGSALFRDIYAENCKNIKISDCRFDSAGISLNENKNYRTANGRGIEINGGSGVMLLHNSINDSLSAVYLSSSAEKESENPDIISVGLFGKSILQLINAENTQNALMVNSVSEPRSNGRHITVSSGFSGILRSYGLIAKGICSESVVSGGGIVGLYAGIFKDGAATAVSVSGGETNVFGSIFPDIPRDYHISATGGSSLAVGNVVKSQTLFAALNGSYMKNHSDGGSVKEEFTVKEYDVSEDGNDESESDV